MNPRIPSKRTILLAHLASLLVSIASFGNTASLPVPETSSEITPDDVTNNLGRASSPSSPPGIFVMHPKLLAGYPVFVADAAKDVFNSKAANLISVPITRDGQVNQPSTQLDSVQQVAQQQQAVIATQQIPAGTRPDGSMSSPAELVVQATPGGGMEQPLVFAGNLTGGGAAVGAPNATASATTNVTVANQTSAADEAFKQQQEYLALLIQQSPYLTDLYYHNLVQAGVMSPFAVPPSFFRNGGGFGDAEQQQKIDAEKLAREILGGTAGILHQARSSLASVVSQPEQTGTIETLLLDDAVGRQELGELLSVDDS